MTNTKLEKIIEKSGLSEKEVELLLKQGTQPQKSVKTYKHFYSPDHTKILLTGDSHIGHKDFDERLFCKMLSVAKKEDVEAIYHAGDILEGMSGRDGHIYELKKVGASAQLDYAEELLNLSEKPVYAITGNHDGWFLKKGNAGLDVGDTLDKEVDCFHFLGYDEADIFLTPKIKLKLIHPGDGSAYALSYKSQKRIESFSGGDKPNIMAQGHYHKAMYFFYRNVHSFDVGTLCGQTPYMRSKNISANKGFWVVDIFSDKKGVDRIENKFYPDYE